MYGLGFLITAVKLPAGNKSGTDQAQIHNFKSVDNWNRQRSIASKKIHLVGSSGVRGIELRYNIWLIQVHSQIQVIQFNRQQNRPISSYQLDLMHYRLLHMLYHERCLWTTDFQPTTKTLKSVHWHNTDELRIIKLLLPRPPLTAAPRWVKRINIAAMEVGRLFDS